MPRKILVVGDTETVFGMRLLGLEGRSISSLEEACSALREASADPDTALILLGDNWAEAMPEAVSETGPLIVEIPSSVAPAHPQALEQRIERALGVRIT